MYQKLELPKVGSIRSMPLFEVSDERLERYGQITLDVKLMSAADFNKVSFRYARLYRAERERKAAYIKATPDPEENWVSIDGYEEIHSQNRSFVQSVLDGVSGERIEGKLNGEEALELLERYGLLDLASTVAQSAQAPTEKQRDLSEP